MNYQKIYDSLIDRGKNRTLCSYKEEHHIIPRCLGGSDEKENLVFLTAEEHYIAHQLLIKIYPDNNKLVKAAAMMIPNRPSNKMYGWLKKRFSVAQSECQTGQGNSQFGTMWITNGSEEKKVSKTEIVPEGWFRKRLSSFIKEKKRIEEKERSKKQKLQEVESLYKIYLNGGYEAVKQTGYKYSKPNLVASFARHLPHFVPQNGKKRN